MLHILSFLSMAAGVIYLVVGVNTYTLNKKSTIGKAFLVLTASLALWSFSYSHAYVADNIYAFSFWNKLSVFGWCLFPALTLYMVFTITESRFLESNLKCTLLFAPAALFCFIDLFLFLPDKPYPDGIYQFFEIANPIYSYIYTLIGMVRLVLWQHKTPYKIIKKQVRIILWTSSCTYLLSVAGEFVIPHFIPSFINCTQIYGVIMIIGIYRAIRKYNFLLTPNELIVGELFEETMDFEFLVNLNGMITRVNRQVLQTLGYGLEDFMSVTFAELLNEENGIRFHEWITEDNIDTTHCKNVRIRTKSGENIPVNMSIVPIRNSRNDLILGYLIIAQDIRAMEELKREMLSHQETMIKLKESEELFRTLTETIPYGIICTKKADKTIFYANKNAEILFKYDFNSCKNMNVEEFYHSKAFRERLFHLIQKEDKVINQVGMMKRSDGEFLAMISMAPAIYKGEEVIFACITDITEQNRLKKNAVKSEEMLNKLMDSIPDPVMVTDIEGRIRYCSKNVESFLGYGAEEENFPKNILDFLEEGKNKEDKSKLTQILLSDVNIIQTTYRKDGGKIGIAEVKASALRDEDKEAFGYVFVARDITEYKKKEEKLARRKAEIEKMNQQLLKSNEVFKQKAEKDSLTNLYNHEYILTLLKKEVNQQHYRPKRLAVMMLDIDYFKKVNDTYGHQTGDKVLMKVSEIIQSCIGEDNYAGRYGGEEFLVILREDQTEESALAVAEKIKERISNCIFENSELRVTISIGLALFHGESVHELIKEADKLLYQAKCNGRSRIERSIKHDN
ncbi:diguanylate cyclase [Anaerocolumna xylanovorans]|uniref:PAS domain S-box-containing protein/diguanylate cyclase (GGDEF) domain-containing protein n=1 Tax=Anaerocolumna xylanovorans DSM 12503 TaxID=1121345 RepID=A0A1M7Y3A1_9FIRM|nr:diguanylate cyclase [Anaerocolumna xylanovorans]SHO46640.1 PAS domain S-box-containing protein/diguanylate cyclase (GGDEF) domain-containing protein [Anaerocolumna xylanovorans DSM 12503]